MQSIGIDFAALLQSLGLQAGLSLVAASGLMLALALVWAAIKYGRIVALAITVWRFFRRRES